MKHEDEIAASLTHASVSRRLVFIGGLHRSGTTALARTLARHQQVSGFSGTPAKEDEGQHLQSVYPPARTYGGAGRFATDPRAHLTDASPLAKPESGRLLLQQWGPYWDLEKDVLVEKSPPNLVMTRFLQSSFPGSSFIMVVRHPAVVALATSRWRRGTSVFRLIENWLTAHETFCDDAKSLERVLVVRYEDMIATPTETLAGVAEFLNLDGEIPSSGIQSGRSDSYVQEWRRRLKDRMVLRGRRFRTKIAKLEARTSRLGYSLLDLEATTPFPVGGHAR